MLNFIKNIGLPELVIIAVVLILLFGGRKVKELSRGLGESSKELKKVKKEYEGALTDTDTAEEKKEEIKEEVKEEESPIV
jgi:sec-independent protein translocase protein TatA